MRRSTNQLFQNFSTSLSLQTGVQIAEWVQKQVQLLEIEHVSSPIHHSVSLSFGIVSLIPTSAIVPEILIQQTDERLYQAKQQGRNQIAC